VNGSFAGTLGDEAKPADECNFGRAGTKRIFQRAFPSCKIQPGQRAGAGAEGVCLEPDALKHEDEKVRQWRVVVPIEGEVLAVFEAAADQQDRQIARLVAAGSTIPAHTKAVKVSS
jgi:hypothetical protein